MIKPDELKQMIQSGLPDAQVQVQDLTGGGDHYQATVISSAFAGKSLVQQHRLVYSVVNDVMASEALHAFALKTYTPERWAEMNETAIAQG
jgi:acid stress-induced BolA-like protein IbaG/YrbA